ncbi:hypothetical protein [Halobacillus sp. Marseille-Q1614]|uniref:hypothetical protein n=1 Tax=Halobacillus sp. Marseille-Q1614 TaxID=2709134 RepID=UPI00156FCCD6|nr:hypothetical protein [Halobacillus sp. Marseille-Q1614]
MTTVQQFIRQDGIRQIITGSILILIMAFFIISLFFTGQAGLWISAVYSLAFGLAGLAIFKSGWEDYMSAMNYEDFKADTTYEKISVFPQRMYIGHRPASIFHANFYDMDGKSYSEIKQHTVLDIKVFRAFVAFFSGGSLMPAAYNMFIGDAHVYTIDKKGGFKWRGYVHQLDRGVVAYTSQERISGKSIFRYIEGEQCRFQAEGDAYIGHFEVKDYQGKVWAVVKRDAIPKEAADRFSKMPGYLVDWKIRKDIPYSLLAFLFLMQTNTNV